jgi:hypothetical protein
VGKKRPCSECRHWFRPDPRVRERQRTCGSAECKRRRHRRIDGAWHGRHPDYDRGRRWHQALERARAAGKLSPGPAGPPLVKVPWDLAQDAMGVQGCVIVAELSAVLARHAQDEMRRQVAGFAKEFRALSRLSRQDEMEPRAVGVTG